MTARASSPSAAVSSSTSSSSRSSRVCSRSARMCGSSSTMRMDRATVTTRPELGSVTAKVDPRPGSLSTSMWPPWCSTISWQIGSPSPVPCGLSVSVSPTCLNRTNRSGTSSGGDAGAGVGHRHDRRAQESRRCRPSPRRSTVNLQALENRLITTCSSRWRSPRIGGQVRVQLDHERQALLLEQRFDGGADLPDQRVHVDLLVTPLDPAGLHLGEVEQVVDEGGEPLALGDDDVEVARGPGSWPAPVAASGSATAG